MTTGKQFKDPLTREQLSAIQERNRENPDVIALLWEIKRLQAVALRFDQIMRSTKEGMIPLMLRNVIEEELNNEPAVFESREELRQAINKISGESESD